MFCLLQFFCRTSQLHSILSIAPVSVAKECELFSGHASKQENHVTVRTQRQQPIFYGLREKNTYALNN